MTERSKSAGGEADKVFWQDLARELEDRGFANAYVEELRSVMGKLHPEVLDKFDSVWCGAVSFARTHAHDKVSDQLDDLYYADAYKEGIDD